MFTLLGAMLTLTGLITNSNTEMYERSLGKNVNLWWGLVLLVFGLFMLLMAKRGAKRRGTDQPPSSVPGGTGPTLPPPTQR